MRRIVGWALVPAVLAAAACGRGKSPSSTAMTDDLRRDLQLASQQPQIQISPDEVAPQSRKQVAMKPVKDPRGTRVIRTSHPTVKASPKPVEIAEAPQAIPQVQVTSTTPAPSETPEPDAPPMARPATIPSPASPGSSRMPGTASGNGQGQGNGVGSTIGGILGAIFGGVTVGDDDHCDPRGGTRRPAGGGVYGGGVYGGGVYGRPRGGIIGGRGGFPILPLAKHP